MIAVFIADLSAWVKKGSRLTVAFIVGLLTIVAGITYFRPEAIGEFFTLAIVWLGLWTGEERWGNPQVWEWVSRGEIAPMRVMIGKATAVACLLMLLVVTVLPLLVMAQMVWGIPVNRLWLLFFTWLITMETSLAIGITAHYFRDQNPYFGAILLITWLVGTALAPWLHPVNPFMRVWEIVGAVNPDDRWIYFMVNMLLFAAMMTAVGWKLRKEVDWRLGQELHH